VRIVAALGGNALLRRGQPLTAENQRANARVACRSLAPLTRTNQLVVSHGNGPQVGLLALQGAAYEPVETYPLDMLGAQTEGMIGYLLQQELGNELPPDARLATLLTQIEVDPNDPAFGNPTKPIGPLYTAEEARALNKEKGWTLKPDAHGFRRVVPSPLPQKIYGLETVEWLLSQGCVVICAGGGGIPVAHTRERVPAGRRLVGIEGVIDKDLASALLAHDIGADVLLIVTDVDGVYTGWGTPDEKVIHRATPQALAQMDFAEGSMGPKVRAACTFVERTGGVAAIGSIADADALLRGETGTTVALDAAGVELISTR
jgi:carbamate kinase